MKRVAILGSSGSIGLTTLRVIRQYPREFKLEALAVNKNIDSLKKQIREFKPSKIALSDEKALKGIKKISGCDIHYGIEGLSRIASDKDVDIVVIALSGSAALYPLLSAIKAGKHIALANKEALVMAGPIIMAELKKSKARLIPVDSEQSAIFQCLEGRNQAELKRLYLTASGGALYDVALKDFKRLKREDILNHPRWKMGRKITVDSATLMNKGLEVIEARWLFDTALKDIEVLVHRQAIIHSMVEFVDGCVLAQLGVTDMSLPIQYALTYPRRLPNRGNHLDFFSVESLTFNKVDREKFPCLDFAYQAAQVSGTAPAAMNAVNEEAVLAFLDQKISFTLIPDIIEKIMSKHKTLKNPNLPEILEADAWAREEASRLISNIKCQNSNDKINSKSQ